MEFDKDNNQFIQDLQQYPNYFQMETQHCKTNFWRQIAKEIEDEKEELLTSSNLNQIKNYNLEAYASYYLGDVDKAEQIISKVLEETNSTSINACAMMAILKYRKGEITKAKRHLIRIKELAADLYNIDIAKSELAYAYTRLDATFYKKAIALYTEVVERNPTNIPWKFGLAVLYRRCMTKSILAMFPDLQLETCFNEAEKYLTYVLENCTDEKDRFFKASTYIELADLYSTANKTNFMKTYIEEIIDIVNQGVQCLPENTTILMKAGRILRHCYKFEEAEELLQKAYNICPNTYICHQLGLFQKSRIIHQHRQLQEYLKRNQRYGPDKWYQASGSWRDPSGSWRDPSGSWRDPSGSWRDHSYNHKSVTQLDPVQRGSRSGSPDLFHSKLWIEEVKRNIILPNESKTEKEQTETLSKVSMKNTAKAGKQPVNVRESSTPPSVSSWPTSTIEKSGFQNDPVVKKARLINSPGNETYDLELSRKLEPCLDLFRQSAELGHERNLSVYYDWGITLLQMIPTKFDEVMDKFNHVLAKEHSRFVRYTCYEQYGICLSRMSESQDFSEISREDYRKNAKEMFRRAIRCWRYCQKINLGKHFDDAEGISIREIILEKDLGHETKPERDMASLNYLVKQYGASLSLYQEVHEKLQHTSDTAMDSEVIKGIINNHLQLEQYTDVLDLLALLLFSKEGLQCLEFKTDVLTQMLHYSIDKHDYQLSKSVFNFEKDQNEELDNDVVIIFNEEDQVTKTKGATLQNWLSVFSNSGLKVIKITETAANLPRHQQQVKLICNSKMAIFILANETPSTELTILMETAVEAQCNYNSFLKMIFPIVINDGMVPDIFNTFRYMKITHQPNTVEEQDKSAFLKTFSEIYLEKAQ